MGNKAHGDPGLCGAPFLFKALLGKKTAGTTGRYDRIFRHVKTEKRHESL